MPPSAVSVDDAATLIEAISAFAWPAAVLVAVILLKGDIQKLMGRIRHGKGPGGIEVDFDEQLDEAQDKAIVASATVPRKPARSQEHDFTAVVLESQDGETTRRRAFPSSRRLPAGEPVSWEWGTKHFPEARYRDPDSGEMRYGWTEALEFIGRPLHPQG